MMTPWARTALILSWILTFIAFLWLGSITLALVFMGHENSAQNQGRYPHSEANSPPVSDSTSINLGKTQDRTDYPKYETEGNASEKSMVLLTVVLVVIAVAQALLFLHQLRLMRRELDGVESSRRLNSVYSIATKFEAEAHKWAEYNFGASIVLDIAWHNASICRLTPYVDYLEHSDRKTYLKISAAWGNYHGGDVHRPIHEGIYMMPEKKLKGYWLKQLFAIVDTLQDIEPQSARS